MSAWRSASYNRSTLWKPKQSSSCRAPKERIFALAAAIDDWPAILPHYRAVTVLEQEDDGRRKVAVMSAYRDLGPGVRLPVTWKSVQICESESGRIVYKHLAGVAAGMWVEWNLADDPWGRGVRVSIRHRLRYPLTILNGWFADEIVGHAFVENIAGRTLATIKGIAETGAG
jgi:hypothetical protein